MAVSIKDDRVDPQVFIRYTSRINHEMTVTLGEMEVSLVVGIGKRPYHVCLSRPMRTSSSANTFIS